ncbi:MAG: hypothetical protein AAFV19_09100 [Pseudomonadota bacterium]
MRTHIAVVLGATLLAACSTTIDPRIVVSNNDAVMIETYYSREGSEGEVVAAKMATAYCVEREYTFAERTKRYTYQLGTITHEFACK